MFTALVQVFKSGGINGTAGTPNFLRDISDLVERTEWTDIMVGGLQDATFEMQLQYEDTTDLLGGNWIIYGCRGGSLHAAVAAGAGSIVVDYATDDPVQQGVPGVHEFALGDAILISNGVDTDLMLVSAVSYSGTQATLTLGSAPGQGTSTLLNAYGAGSVVARLQFQGIITSRQRTTEWTNKYALRALGMGWRYNNVIASFDVQAQDSATSILKIIEQYASTVPEVIVNAANFAAANGIMYTGTSNGAQPVMQVLTDILRTESGGATTQTPNEASFWAFWVDALRQAHHQKVKTDIPSPATPTYVIDLLNGNAYGDVCGAVTPTDMDMSQLLNTVLVMGGKGSDGNQVEIIVTNSSSITEYGHYEGTLSNPNITDQNALALWASGIIGVRGWPRETSRLSLTVDSCRMTARDQLGVTGFTDGSELVTNPVEIRRQADAKHRIVTSMITLSQMQPDMTSLMSQIANQRSIRHLEKVPDVRLGDAYVVSGCQVTYTPGTLNYTVSPGVVSFGGTLYNIPAFSGSAPSSGTVRIGAQVGGTPPNGYTLPCIVPLPSYTGISTIFAQNVYDFGANGLVAQTNFVGIEIAKIGALNGSIIATTDERALGGVSGLNLVPIPAGTTGSPSLQSIVVSPDGPSTARAWIVVNLPASWVGAPWVRQVNLLQSQAGANLWTVVNHTTQTNSAIGLGAPGLGIGQSYDFAVEVIPYNGVASSVYLLGTSPTLPSSEIAAGVLLFSGVSLDPSGYWVMPSTREIYPGSKALTQPNFGSNSLLILKAAFRGTSNLEDVGFAFYTDTPVGGTTYNNGYLVQFMPVQNRIGIYKKASGTFTEIDTVVVALPITGTDTTEHTLLVAITHPNAGTIGIAAYVDGILCSTANDASGAIYYTGLSGPCARYTTGSQSSGPVFINPNSIEIAQGSQAYEQLHPSVRQVINASGQVPASTPFNSTLPNFVSNMLSDVGYGYSSTTSSVSIWLTNLAGTGYPTWIPPDGGAAIIAPAAACGSSSAPLSVVTGLTISEKVWFIISYNVTAQTSNVTHYAGTAPTDTQVAAALADGALLVVVATGNSSAAIIANGGSGTGKGGGGHVYL